MNRDVELTTKFRGLNVEQVDEYLETLNKAHMDEIVKIKQLIEISYKEKDKLYQHLLDLQYEKERQTRSNELMNLALIRAKETVDIFQKKAEEESREIIQSAKAQTESYEQKIKSIENDIAMLKAYIDSLLQNTMQVLKDNSQERMVEVEEPATGKVVGKIFPVGYRARQAAPDVSKIFEPAKKNGDEDISTESINSELVKSDQIKSESFNTEIAVQQKMTADGFVAPDITSRVEKSKQDQQYKQFLEKISKIMSTPTPREEVIVPPAPKTGPLGRGPIVRESVREFWDSSNDHDFKAIKETAYTSAPANLAAFTGVSTVAAAAVDKTVSTGEIGKKDSFAEPEVGTGFLAAAPGKENGPVERKKTGLPADSNADDLMVKSQAVAEEIHNIRCKYIVGKIAGEDLRDGDGNLIIAKGGIITPAIVTKAEAEGKLPELIVNMLIPGMEE